jgi:peptidoglycan/LPS O-acetylase OafA/YrhL
MLKPGITRFLLAAFVIFFHISKFFFLGRFAVCSFFILSGYWITLMFEKKYSHKKSPLKTFYVSRIWRLFPVFYAFTIIGFIVWWLTDSTVPSLINNLHGMNSAVFWLSNSVLFTYYSLPKVTILVPAWSLDIELQFYILFPLLFYIGCKNYKRLNYIFLLSLLLFVYISVSYSNLWIKNSMLVYLYLFVFGMIIYFRKIQFKKVTEIICIVVVLIIIALQYVFSYTIQHYKDEASIYYIMLSFVLVALFVPTLANSVRKASDKNDKFWGEMSFLIYLSHWVWIKPYGVFSAGTSSSVHLLYLLLFFIATLLSSFVIYNLIDRPMEKLRHQWINKQA